ncbi:MAG: hypothetical protein ACLSUS_03820 [Opitutales bacterium]|mgnify:FL=1
MKISLVNYTNFDKKQDYKTCLQSRRQAATKNNFQNNCLMPQISTLSSIISFGSAAQKQEVSEEALKQDAQVFLKSLEKEQEDIKKARFLYFDNIDIKCRKKLKDKALFRQIDPIDAFNAVYEDFSPYYIKKGEIKQIEKYSSSLNYLFNSFLNAQSKLEKNELKNIALQIKAEMQKDMLYAGKYNKDRDMQISVDEYFYLLGNYQNRIKKFMQLADKDIAYTEALKVIEPLCNREGKVRHIKYTGYEKIVKFLDKFEKFNFEDAIFKPTPKTPDISPAVNKSEPVETVNTPKTETKPDSVKTNNTTEAKPATGVTLKPIKHDYSLLDEYKRRVKIHKEYAEPLRNRAKTPEEKIQEEKLRKAWLALREKAREENISFVRIKQESDFSSDPVKNKQEKFQYIAKQVLPYLNVSEASALDGLEMFAKFGTRYVYPNGRKNYEILTEGISFRPDEEMTDRLLNKFLDVWEKISEKNIDKYKDNEYLCDVLVYFTRLKKNIEEDTILRGLKLLKKLTNQKQDVDRIEYSLIGDYHAKYKDSKKIKDAIDDLKDYVKDCPFYYRLPEDR